MTLELRHTDLDPDYRNKWNERLRDFVHIYKDGEKVSDTLYRTGAMGGKVEDDYFLMLKHVESMYDDEITEDEDRKRHLASHWCIIDKNGVEKVVFDSLRSPYLKGGMIYSLDGKYYNIETNECYCTAHTSMSSEEYIFLGILHNKGVMQINKKDGSFIIHK